MAIEITEKEMIERFADGLKQSASSCKEFLTAEENRKPTIFTEFVHGIKVAAGSAHQLAHSQENPKWFDVRDLLESVVDQVQVFVLAKHDIRQVWVNMKNTLEAMHDKGLKLATAKSMSRTDVLTDLATREIAARVNN